MSRNSKNAARAESRRAHSILRAARLGRAPYRPPNAKHGSNRTRMPSDTVMERAEGRVNASLAWAQSRRATKRRRVFFRAHAVFEPLTPQTQDVKRIPRELQLRYEPIWKTVESWYEKPHRAKEARA